MKNFLSNKYLRYGLFVFAGIFLGWLLFHSNENKPGKHNHAEETGKVTTWTCSMHPQIRKDAPGKCPICGMDLIPLNQLSSDSVDPDAIHLSKDAAQLANVQTSVVTKQKPVKEIRLYGKVQADERLLQSQVAHIPGRIEKLMVNFTGDEVRQGQTLALIYSPELVTAQQELLEAAKTKDIQPEIYEAAKEKLRQWKVADNQIDAIERSGKVENNFEVVSNTNGVVTSRRVNNGDHISPGTVLFDVTNLSSVWVLFDAYESDLPFINKGNKIDFTVQALPGRVFSGNVVFIDPVIDPVTRVAKVRVEINNSSGKLKPEMFVTGIVKANLAEYSDKFIIPRSSVLWTGKRSIVYVKQPDTDEALFKMREIEVGPMLGNSYVVLSGLNEGEEIITNGTFNVDAAAQLEGKPSMMNTVAGQKTDIHDHTKAYSDEKQIEKPNKTETLNLTISKEFRTQLNNIYESYLVLKNDLVQSDAGKTKKDAVFLNQILDKTDKKLLSGETFTKWTEISNSLKKYTSSISSSASIEEQRTGFIGLSDQLYKALKLYGLPGKTVYYQFCPMANNNKGAFWLSEVNEIRNPYFGEAMLTCGETRDVIK